MRKLNKGRIHPSPPQPVSSATANHHLSLLPLAIATLAATLAPEDQEVLAYLLSISATNTNFSTGQKPTNKGGDHPPQFNCNCFRCYTTFWARWDTSPNRKLIHDIIDVYEDGLVRNRKVGKKKKERKHNKVSFSSSTTTTSFTSIGESETYAPRQSEQRSNYVDDGMGMGSSQNGTVRKLVNFVGERIWGVWGS